MVVFGAVAPSLFPLLHALIDFRNDVLVPSQIFFAPVAFLSYLWMKRRYGSERTMAEYWAGTSSVAVAADPMQPVLAPKPAAV